MANDSKSVWAWLGCGCAAIVGVGLIVIGTIAFFGIRTARTMSDPVARQDTALEIMSAEAIPVGYETQLVMKIPFYVQVVVLEGDGRGFVFLGGLRTKADLAAAMADEDSFDRELGLAGLRIPRGRRILARDALRIGSAEARYVLFDGQVHFDPDGRAGGDSIVDFDFGDLGSDTGADHRGAELGAAILIRCPEGGEPGLGLWTGPRAVAEAEPDEASLIDFLEQFGLCARR